MYQRALAGYEKRLGPDDILTSERVHWLGIVYRQQGELVKAEQIYQRTLT